jgi:hypothetical protein
MKQTQHTPGPWREYNAKGSRILNNWSVCNRDGTRIANIEQMPGQSSEEEHANARLIAAAPELLEALREMTERGGWMPSDERFIRAKAAIAKATQA